MFFVFLLSYEQPGLSCYSYFDTVLKLLPPAPHEAGSQKGQINQELQKIIHLGST